jgi:thymidylate kinase
MYKEITMDFTFDDLTDHEIFCLIADEPDITFAFINAVQGSCSRTVAKDMLMDYIEEKEYILEEIREGYNARI